MNFEHILLDASLETAPRPTPGLTLDKFQKQAKAVRRPRFSCPKAPSWAPQSLNSSPCFNLPSSHRQPRSHLLKALRRARSRADPYLNTARPTADVSPVQRAAVGPLPSPVRFPLQDFILRILFNRKSVLTLMSIKAPNQRPL